MTNTNTNIAFHFVVFRIEVEKNSNHNSTYEITRALNNIGLSGEYQSVESRFGDKLSGDYADHHLNIGMSDTESDMVHMIMSSNEIEKFILAREKDHWVYPETMDGKEIFCSVYLIPSNKIADFMERMVNFPYKFVIDSERITDDNFISEDYDPNDYNGHIVTWIDRNNEISLYRDIE